MMGGKHEPSLDQPVYKYDIVITLFRSYLDHYGIDRTIFGILWTKIETILDHH